VEGYSGIATASNSYYVVVPYAFKPLAEACANAVFVEIQHHESRQMNGWQLNECRVVRWWVIGGAVGRCASVRVAGLATGRIVCVAMR